MGAEPWIYSALLVGGAALGSAAELGTASTATHRRSAFNHI
jgi:hypothetical protein